MRYNYTISVGNQRRGGFSETEIKHLTIALFVLALAFAISFSGGRIGDGFPIMFGISLLSVGTAFLFHELAHRMIARKYGCWAEFRMWPMGLMMAILFSFFGFVFAAPGAVMISGYITEEQNGKISAAGPVTNWMVGTLFLGGSIALLMFDNILWFILAFVAYINLFIGGFNLLPIGPLDGAKIFRWSVPNYITIAGLIIGTLALGSYLGPLRPFIPF